MIDGLQLLECSGYDSAGIAVSGGGKIIFCKELGHLVNLERAFEKSSIWGMCGIGHPRGATHGAPSKSNSHPHFSSDGAISVVRNGIIKNDVALREELAALGHVFLSDTDAEVISI